jgi:hypothetical protein
MNSGTSRSHQHLGRGGGGGGVGGVSSCFDQPISYDFDQVVKIFPKNVVDGGVGEFAKKNFRTKGVVIIYGEGGW